MMLKIPRPRTFHSEDKLISTEPIANKYFIARKLLEGVRRIDPVWQRVMGGADPRHPPPSTPPPTPRDYPRPSVGASNNYN